MPNKPLKCTLTNVKKTYTYFHAESFIRQMLKQTKIRLTDGRTDEPITIVCPQSAALKIEKVY